MLMPRRFLLMLAFTLAGSASMARAQVQQPLSLDQESRYGPLPHNMDKALDSNSELRRSLISSGVLSRTGPYRVALPLASFGENGPKLLFTYVPRMRDGAGSKVFMFFIRMNID